MTQDWSQGRPWQLNGALILLGTGLLVLSHQLVSENDHFTIGFSGVSGWSATIYVAAVVLVLTQPANRHTFSIILGLGIACRLAPLFSEPFLSSDIYRYVWDGIVQHAHISPYRYVPGDPTLTFLREPNQEIFDNINRRDYARTIYPPGAQLLFFLITWISPTVIAIKTFMVLFEGLTLYTLVKFLGVLGRPREQAILYAWCPLLIWEIAGSGHLDSAAIAFIMLALVFRYRCRPVLTGLALGIAVMMKFYPIVLLPALLMRSKSTIASGRSPWNPRKLDLAMPAAMVTVVITGYVVYSSVGKLVFGFLGGYVQEEGMDSGTRYFLLELSQRLPGLHNLPSWAYLLSCALIFAALSLWAYRVGTGTSADNHTKVGAPSFEFLHPTKDGQTTAAHCLLLAARAPFLIPGFALACALMFLFSPHYPWYIAWLIPFLTLVPNLTILTYVVAMFYLCTTAIAVGVGPKQFLLNEYLYSSIAIAAIIGLVLSRLPAYRALFGRNAAKPISPRPE